MSNRDPIAKCLRRVDWHVTLLHDVSTLCALDVILSAAPVEKTPALYLIQHVRSGLSTNGPITAKNHLGEYIANSKVFLTTLG